jgi:glycosyltransferase involved in cell wall biosynthesis
LKKLSIIVPIYNEGLEFDVFLKDLYTSLKKLPNPYEVIVLDSNTANSSWKVIKEYSKREKTLRGYLLTHPGIAVTDKTNKYNLGFELATGDYIISMDGDGQDRPEEIHKFVEKLDNGSDFVIGYKQKRRDGLIYMLTSRLANGLIRALTGVKVHDMNNGFKAFQSSIAKSLNLHSGHFRFLPVIASAKRWKIDEVKVEHRAREFGSGKFNFLSRLQGGLFDMSVVYIISKMGDSPMYTIGWSALTTFLLGLISLILSILVSNIVLSIASLLTIFFALNLFVIGVILEYVRSESTKKNLSNLVVEEI